MNRFHLRILEADNAFYEGECVSLVVPTIEGQYGIMAGHSNMVLAIVPGALKYQIDENDNFIIAAVSNGIVKIENGQVLILVDSAERPDEIDINRARREAERAREALKQKGSKREYNAAQARLSRAINRLKVKEDYDAGI